MGRGAQVSLFWKPHRDTALAGRLAREAAPAPVAGITGVRCAALCVPLATVDTNTHSQCNESQTRFVPRGMHFK